MSAPEPGAAPEIVVTYREGRGVPAWRRRHDESPVPGLWPYGLDEIASTGHTVADREVPELSGLRRKLAGAVGVRPPAAGAGAPVAALSWDERTAVPMLAGVAARHHYSGVIWATDSVAAGQDTASLKLAARALRAMAGLWVLSRPQADSVRRWLGPSCPPVSFLRFGVDPTFYDVADYPEAPHVVSVGGDRDRDAQTLFAALELVRIARPEVRCTVQSTSSIEPPPGVSKVASLPHRGVADLLATATVVAIATRPNLHASGMTVGLEAMSVGRPVVVCDTPGMDDYFEDGRTSRRVPVGDPAAMAAAILELLADPAAAAAMGAAGRMAVLDHFTTRSMCRDLTAIVTGAGGAAVPH